MESTARSPVRPGDVKRALRHAAESGLRLTFRVVDPVRTAWLAARFAPDPQQAATAVDRRIAELLPVSPSLVVANYLRGLVLFGRRDGRSGLEWRWIPERSLITAEGAVVPRDLHRVWRRSGFVVRFNTDLERVVESCREGRDSWITPQLVDVYRRLDELGLVTTVEVYREGTLVGGLWGLDVGGTLAIMSMFHHESQAGSVALAAAVEQLGEGRAWTGIDCGPLRPHFEKFGAVALSIDDLAAHVLRGTGRPSRGGLPESVVP